MLPHGAGECDRGEDEVPHLEGTLWNQMITTLPFKSIIHG
jgi:hypothetical protein